MSRCASRRASTSAPTPPGCSSPSPTRSAGRARRGRRSPRLRAARGGRAAPGIPDAKAWRSPRRSPSRPWRARQRRRGAARGRHRRHARRAWPRRPDRPAQRGRRRARRDPQRRGGGAAGLRRRDRAAGRATGSGRSWWPTSAAARPRSSPARAGGADVVGSLPIGSGALAEATCTATRRRSRSSSRPRRRPTPRSRPSAARRPTSPGRWAAARPRCAACAATRLGARRWRPRSARHRRAGRARRALDLDLHVERVRLLPAGLVLLAAVARAAQCPLHVGCGGLREGVVLDLLGEVE